MSIKLNRGLLGGRVIDFRLFNIKGRFYKFGYWIVDTKNNRYYSWMKGSGFKQGSRL